MFNFPTPQSVMGIIVSQNDKLSSFRSDYTAPKKGVVPISFSFSIYFHSNQRHLHDARKR